MQRTMKLPTLEDFGRRPRESLMWVPRAIDVARIAAACRVGGKVVADPDAPPSKSERVLSATSEGTAPAPSWPTRGPLVADVGAGTGLLAHLLEQEGVAVAAYDPAPPERTFHPIEKLDADKLTDSYDAAIVSWMEAGKDYRDQVAELAPIVVNAYDVEGGCGVLGQTDFQQQGFQVAVTWTTPSFEDVEHALTHRGLPRKGYPGNRVDVLTRKVHLLEPLRQAVDPARPGRRLPWEDDMDKLGL